MKHISPHTRFFNRARTFPDTLPSDRNPGPVKHLLRRIVWVLVPADGPRAMAIKDTTPAAAAGSGRRAVRAVTPDRHRPCYMLLLSTAAAAMLMTSAGHSAYPNRQPNHAYPDAVAIAAPGPEAGQPMFIRSIDLIGRDRLREFYAARGYEAVWVRANRVTDRARAVLGVLREAGKHGLPASAYGVARLEALVEATDAESLTEFELSLSEAFIRYAEHIGNGRLNEGERPARSYQHAVDPVEFLEQSARAANPADILQSRAPRHHVYAGLRQAVLRYQTIEAAGGWPLLPDGPTLRAGDRDPRVVTLRERLRVTGDFPARRGARQYFEPALEQAVEHFQRRHGLEVDGIVGPRTRAALNVPANARRRQLAMNLERSRWLPSDLGERHVLVNIAGFSAKVVENHRTKMEMKVIVGKRYQQTPIFSDEIRYLEVNPYWNVPASIARNEILPAVIDNPGYLAENNLEVLSSWDSGAEALDPASIDWQSMSTGRFPYRFRQKPGPDNALGRVKFMFPNEFSVYMHDTPARHLFDRESRTLSHGCIRLSRPLALAEYLLKDHGWSRSRIESQIEAGNRAVVGLEQRVPVHITYLTAWMQDDTVHFRDDVYDRDTRLARALFKDDPDSRIAMTGQ